MRRVLIGLAAGAVLGAGLAAAAPSAAPQAQDRPDDARVGTIDPFAGSSPSPAVEAIDPFAPAPQAIRDEGPSVGRDQADAPVFESATVAEQREAMETDMAVLGELVQKARRQGDLVRLNCLRDKEVVAAHILEVATSEILILRDGAVEPGARKFAAEKLAAAVERLAATIEAAQSCAGEQGPEDEDDLTRNETEEPEFVPWIDPTRESAVVPIPPAVSDTVPPVIASPSR